MLTLRTGRRPAQRLSGAPSLPAASDFRMLRSCQSKLPAPCGSQMWPVPAVAA
jgi:hypothetical protein